MERGKVLLKRPTATKEEPFSHSLSLNIQSSMMKKGPPPDLLIALEALREAFSSESGTSNILLVFLHTSKTPLYEASYERTLPAASNHFMLHGTERFAGGDKNFVALLEVAQNWMGRESRFKTCFRSLCQKF